MKYISLDLIKPFLNEESIAALPMLIELAETEPGHFRKDLIIEVPDEDKT